jgi:hypothetical protein
VVVDDAGGLHPGVNDDGTYELEAAFFEGSGDFFGELGFGGDFAGRLWLVFDGFVTGHVPDVGGEVFAGGFHGVVDTRAVDGGFDFGSGTDDSGVLEEALDVFFGEFGYAFGIEVVKGRAKGVALAENGDPGEAGLEAVEHEGLPEGSAVVFGDAPLGVVVGLHEGVAFGPGAAREGFRGWHVAPV